MNTTETNRKKNDFLCSHAEKLKMNQYWYSADTIDAMVKDIQQHATRAAFLSTPSLYFSLTDETLKKNSMVFDFDEMWSSDPGFVKYNFKEPEKIPKELRHTFDFIVVDPPFITTEVWEKYIEAAQMLLIKEDGEQKHSDGTTSNDSEKDGKTAENTANKQETKEAQINTNTTDKSKSQSQSEGGWDDFFSNISNPFASSKKVTNSPSKKKKDTGGWPGGKGKAPSKSPFFPPSTPKGKLMFTTVAEHEEWLHGQSGVSARRFRPSIPNLIYQYSLYTNYPSDRLAELNPEIDG